MSAAPTIEPLGDHAVLIRIGDRIDIDLNAQALALAEALRHAHLPGVVDIAPAYASVCVRYDIAACGDPSAGVAPYAALARRIEALLRNRDFVTVAPPGDTSTASGQTGCIEIPVCYGGEFGPDLDAVAAHCGLDEDTVVARHSEPEYRVAMLGFMPGFAYLLGLHESLHVPRRASPRTRVPAGSVAIGGAQTGIYPRELPGGWQLIGRTPLALFDAARSDPALLHAGQRVRFRPIDAAGYAALLAAARQRR